MILSTHLSGNRLRLFMALAGAALSCATPDTPVAAGGAMAASGSGAAGQPSSLAGATSGGHTPAAGAVSDPGGSLGSGAQAVSGAASGGVPSFAGAAGGAASADSAGSGSGGTACGGPVGKISGPLATGIAFVDDEGERVNAHGGGIIRVGDTFYLHGELFPSGSTDNLFHGFTMYSSKDLTTWHDEGIILPQQSSGELGPNRRGERPHIIRCPGTGEFVLYAHAASSDYQTDKEVVYATSATVNGQYVFRGALKNAKGALIVHSDMSAYADDSGAYVLTESGHLFTLTSDCHAWESDKSMPAVNGTSGGAESPTVFKAQNTYYWIGSNKTGWRANNNFYSTAPAMTGPWTYQGFLAPVGDPQDVLSGERTWLSQSTWVQPIVGCRGTTFLYVGDHWDGTEDTKAPGKHNDLATYVFQPLILDGSSDKMLLPTYKATWHLDVGAGTWSE